jgi:hypothetical protein
LKKYIVTWKKEEKEFADVHQAIHFAEKMGETGVYSAVFSEIDGVRSESPFFYCSWEI